MQRATPYATATRARSAFCGSHWKLVGGLRTSRPGAWPRNADSVLGTASVRYAEPGAPSTWHGSATTLGRLDRESGRDARRHARRAAPAPARQRIARPIA